MKICQRCNLSYEDDFSFCSKCGSPLTVIIETMFCPYCGKRVENCVDFCPYCGKSLHRDTSYKSYNNAMFSEANSQYNYSPQQSSPQVNTNSSSTFNSGKLLSSIKNTPFIKWSIIVFLFVIDLMTAVFTDVITRTYTMDVRRIGLGLQPKGNVSGEKVLTYLLGFGLIFLISWFIINKLHPKAAKILWYILLYVVIARVVFLFMGPIYGAIIFICFFAWEYYSKKKNNA